MHNYLPFGGLQVLGLGDFFQLPPIEKEGTPLKFAFESEFWTAVFPPRHCFELHKSFRQSNGNFLGLLDRLRVGDVSDEEMLQLVEASQERRNLRDPTLAEHFSVRLFGVKHKVKAFNLKQQSLLVNEEAHTFVRTWHVF